MRLVSRHNVFRSKICFLKYVKCVYELIDQQLLFLVWRSLQTELGRSEHTGRKPRTSAFQRCAQIQKRSSECGEIFVWSALGGAARLQVGSTSWQKYSCRSKTNGNPIGSESSGNPVVCGLFFAVKSTPNRIWARVWLTIAHIMSGRALGVIPTI